MDAEDFIRVETNDGSASFQPGDLVEGTVRWQFAEPPQEVELRLFWFTEGRGDQDLEVMATIPFANPGAHDRRSVSRPA